MNHFVFDLNAKVRINVSMETGTVRARSEYATSSPNCYLVSPNCYLIEYKENGTGTAREQWFTEDQITTA